MSAATVDYPEDVRPRTRGDCARGVSREYIRQIQRAAYDRMLDARMLRVLGMAP
jgi:hypothetical protein